MRARASCAAALGSALLIATPAAASHSHPATYTGGVSGGSLEFDVSADGTAITRLRIVAVSECARHDMEITSRIAIVDHAFNYTSSALWFSGGFPAPRAAEGTLRYHQDFPACTSSLRDWSAMTSTPLPSPADTTAPQVALSGPATQRAGRTVAVTVTSSEAGAARASGRVGRHALGGRAVTLAAHTPARLALRVPSRARRAIGRALRGRGRPVAVVTVSVRDAAGNRTDRSRTIRLRRR